MSHCNISASYDNLGKPVSQKRLETAYEHLKAEYPDMPASERWAIVEKAAQLIERDQPYNLWGKVSAEPPLNKLSWVERMMLGAALMAEPIQNPAP